MDDRGERDAADHAGGADGGAAVGAAAVVAAERQLLDPAVRRDEAAVDAALDPAFREIGQSGRLWSREEMRSALATGEMSATLGDHTLTEPRVERLGEGVWLLTYVLESGSGRTRRASIWRETASGLRCVFHQGTRAPEASVGGR